VSHESLEKNVMNAEALWCEVKTIRNSEVVGGVCYRSQAANLLR
jgi:hypothetical protein